MQKLKDEIIRALRSIYDPEIPVNIYDLGLIYDLQLDDRAHAHVRMTLTTPNCPVAETMPQQVKTTVESINGVSGATVDVVWDPPWSREMMSEDAKLVLEMMGISWADPLGRPTGPTSLTVGRTSRPPDQRSGPKK